MTTSLPRAIATFCMLTALLPAASGKDVFTPAIKTSNILLIEPNNTFHWNGTLVSERTLFRVLKAAGKRKPEPEIHIETDRLTRYDEVARILAEIQGIDGMNIGLTGVDSGK